MIKTHTKKKVVKHRGRKMGTMGRGARKMGKKSGKRGGTGMAGTGKRGDQKKTLVLKLYGNNYFGKKGITSRGTKKDKSNKINLQDIEKNLNSFIKSKAAKKVENGIEITLKDYKILGKGEIKGKLFVKARAFSKQAEEKIKNAGGDVIVVKSNKKEA